MKILHLDTERTWRGGEQQMCYLAQGLIDRGHDCDVVARPGSECEGRARELGLRVHPLKIGSDVAVLAARRIAKLADKLGAEIVHAHTSKAHLAAVMAKGFSRRLKKAVVHRRVDFSIHKLPLGLSGLKYRWGVDRYIAVTAAVKRVMIEDGIDGDLIEVIHSGTVVSRFTGTQRKPGLREELKVPAGARVVGNVGFLVDHKDHFNLLDAAAIVLKEFPDAFFVVVGEGELRPQIEEKARALGIQDRVNLAGFRSDVPQCLAEFEVFCLSSWGEGIGGVVLEAMAAGLPVATASAGGLDEVVKNGRNGLIVPTRDSRALAEAVCRHLRNPDAAQAMAREGHRTACEEFTVDRMVEKTISLYEGLRGTD